MYFTSGIQLSEALAALPGSKVGTYVPFDSAFYAATYMGTYQGTLTPLEHFVQVGADRMYKPNSTFDPVYYANKYDDLRGAGLNSADLIYHFMQYGLDEGRAPSQALADFDGNFYLAANPDVAKYVNANLDQFGGSLTNGALAHYVKFGGAEGRSGPGTADTAGRNFILEESTVAGVKAMVLHGDQDIRIDMTKTANQITGLDLNGDGVIANDGKENALNVKPASGYVAVDAYTRLDNGVVNENNMAKVFLGDIKYDGSGFAGDGVSTNGNVVLGGLGADTILGGIGNDFLAGGGVAVSRNGGTDTLSGGRNADFLFAELSLLSNTDGNKLFLDGGSTADDTSAANGQSSQDSDWLLLQASDDDERIEVVLNENPGVVGTTPDAKDGTLVTRAGQYASLRDIENIDASGNTYGFLKGLTTAVGGAPTGAANPNNNGIGSSGQLNITGSLANNIIIGGYDNDSINGGAGNDLLMGGNLNMLIDPNLVGLVGNNDGRDELIGGAGADNIVFEADGGIIEGGAFQNRDDDPSVDTLWLTANSLGAVKTATALTPVAADALTTDNTLRFDLGVGKQGGLANYAGYGGADKNAATGNYTADQTNYTDANAGLRVQVQDMENIIATGLGAIDYKAAGANSATDLTFDNQQNFKGYNGNLDLRGTSFTSGTSGTSGANILYAAGGNDTIEGRGGNDYLSGGDGIDTFVFGTMDGGGAFSNSTFVSGQTSYGDNIDVIWRQSDVNGDNLWDGTYERDFGIGATTTSTPSGLSLTLNVSAIDTVSNPLVQNDVRQIEITVGGVDVILTTPGMAGAATMAALLTEVQAALVAHGDTALTASLVNNTITIADAQGRVMGGSGYLVVQNSGGSIQNTVEFNAALSNTVKDVLLFTSYENRADGELTNDNSFNGSTITLGQDSYAQDRVVSFVDNDGKIQTRIAEDQAYAIEFTNLTTQDTVTISVNGVQYQLTVGKDLDGSAIAAEDGLGDTQANIQAAFLNRLTGFINSFMDTNTAAGQVNAALSGSTLTLTQVVYNGEQTVFMKSPVVTLGNASGGEPAKAVVTNNAQHEVLLYEYDGRDNGLNAANVKFIGATGVSQSTLETAKSAGQTLTGNEAIVIDGGVDNLFDTTSTGTAIANNTNTNAALSTNFSVHGDDLLIGGIGNDTISGRTGDDRVVGSLGTDVLDGGKDWYEVKVLGEAKSRVIEMNTWEAANPAARVAALAGLTLSSTTLIRQTQNGNDLVSGLFNDTLIFQQADIGANARFTITLDNFTVTAGNVVNLTQGGAGRVEIDVAGDGAVDAGHVTTFTNFENIRTVSGTGFAVAGNGQGNDTLNVAALSTAAGGIMYNLTNDGSGGGEVRYNKDAWPTFAALAHPADADYETLVMKVDGVENVIGGNGNDLLVIDETEAAKDNTFNGGLGIDRIEYRNNYTTGGADAEPQVAIKVLGVGSSTVTMTGGRVASAGAAGGTDTLTGVEFITLAQNTAGGASESDVLDVTALTSGAVVSYVDGTVKDLAGVTQVVIENIAQIENIWADGNDTVIVADASIMATNTRSDFTTTPQTPMTDLAFSTFLSFDTLDTATGKRVAFADLTSSQIPKARNQGQFTFNLSKTGTGIDIDTVDYSNAVDSISVVVELDATRPNQYVLVDQEGAANETFDGVDNSENDRVDVLIGVERIVASQAESILDLTSSTKGLEVKFEALDVANRVAALDRDVYNVKITDITGGTPLSRSYVEYRDAGLLDTGPTAVTQATAIWNSIEGSDYAERIIMNSAHSTDNGTFNLRGGANEMKYNELTRSINTTISVTEFDAANALNTGRIVADVTFQDGSGGALTNGGTHRITSYTQQNGIASGSLRIAASQDAEDRLSFTGSQEKLFILGVTGTTDNLIEVKVGSASDLNSIVLTGYEFLQDAATNDVYDMKSLANVLGNLTLNDNVTADHDTIKVYNDAAAALYGGSATTISLAGLNAAPALPATTGFNFDFDVLDVTGVTATTVTTLLGTAAGADDEVVLGAINNIATLTNFESAVITEATLAQTGNTFVLNTTANTLTGGTKVLTDSTNTLNTVSFRGLVGSFDGGQVANVTTGVTFSVAGASTDAVSVLGGNGADTITGGAGADTLIGGQGNDTLDGGFVAAVGEVQTITLAGGAAVLAGTETLTITNGVDTLVVGASGSAAEFTVATATADADQIGALLAGLTTTQVETELGYAAGSIAATAYDAAANQFSITFAASAGAQADATAAVTALSTMTAVAAETTAWAARGESVDTYVFEATAALNGVDTLNNVDVSDTLDFSAFLGGVGAVSGTHNAAASFALANGQVAIAFNQASVLTAADVTGLTAGQKAVVLMTADADGVADATNDAYNVYYVTGTAGDEIITLVGTVNSATELAAADVVGLI